MKQEWCGDGWQKRSTHIDTEELKEVKSGSRSIHAGITRDNERILLTTEAALGATHSVSPVLLVDNGQP